MLRVPGISAAVLHGNDEAVFCLGITNVEHPLPVTDDTLFQLASITKTITATALMRLVERGDMQLDAPVRAHLPGFRLADEAVGAAVTLRRLLTHTAGWVGEHIPDTGAGDDALARAVADLATRDLTQVAPPGVVHSYNNTGYTILGRVLEVATGQTFEDAIRDLVFRPLGMSSSFFRNEAAQFITRRIAAGHEIHPVKPMSPPHPDDRAVLATQWGRPRSANPSGGVVATIRDLLRYARFHVGHGTAPEGTRLLQEETLMQMRAPAVQAQGEAAWGLGWGVLQVEGQALATHSGTAIGQRSSVTVVPGRGLAIALLTNADRGDAVARRLRRVTLRELVGLREPDPRDGLQTMAQDVDAATTAAYVGDYRNGGTVLRVTDRPGGLALEALSVGQGGTPETPLHPPVPLGFYAPDLTMGLAAPLRAAQIDFVRHDGRVRWVRRSGRLYARVAG